MSRVLPTLDGPQLTHISEYKNAIRSWLEWLTGATTCIQIDWGTYQTVLDWATKEQVHLRRYIVIELKCSDYRPIIEEVLSRRLSSQPSAANNALILAQTLPPTSLIPLIVSLKKLSVPAGDAPISHTNIIAQTLLGVAEEQKSANAATDEKSKWEAWCGLYGRPGEGHHLPPLPTDVEWGMWAMASIPAEEWWSVSEKND